MVRDGVLVLVKVANALCENALRGWCLGMGWCPPDGKGWRSGSSEGSKRSLRERPAWLVFRDGTELVGFVWFGFSLAVTRCTRMVCRVTVSFNLF
nr:MAG TPA: Protein of unknown function (DUF1673) [Caudoviricetes sp.]